MGNIRHTHKRRGKRHFIRIHVTPKSPGTRALLKRFTKEVKAFEKKWRAAAAKAKRK